MKNFYKTLLILVFLFGSGSYAGKIIVKNFDVDAFGTPEQIANLERDYEIEREFTPYKSFEQFRNMKSHWKIVFLYADDNGEEQRVEIPVNFLSVGFQQEIDVLGNMNNPKAYLYRGMGGEDIPTIGGVTSTSNVIINLHRGTIDEIGSGTYERYNPSIQAEMLLTPYARPLAVSDAATAALAGSLG